MNRIILFIHGGSWINGKKEDMEHLIEIIKSASKRNVENNLVLTEQQKEDQQHQIDIQLETIKQLSGIANV